jgi:hypothetical protein
MTPQTPYYELRDLVAVSALAALFAYLAGRAHAERAAERARERRQQARNRHASRIDLNNNNNNKGKHTK